MRARPQLHEGDCASLVGRHARQARRGELPGQVKAGTTTGFLRSAILSLCSRLPFGLGVATAYLVLIFGLFFGPMVITGLKGQWALFAAGWITVGTVWIIAALRLAPPKSWWERRFYSPGKLARAQARYQTAYAEPGAA